MMTRARLDELLALARAATPQRAWTLGATAVVTEGFVDPGAAHAHIAAWSPAAVIAHLEWVRRVVKWTIDSDGCGCCASLRSVETDGVTHDADCPLREWDNAATSREEE